MIKEDAAIDGILNPEELALLQRIFDDALRGTGYPRQSLEANLLASLIIHLYLRGVRKEESLRALLAA
ncbi:hypothetical protein ACQKGC_10395 [Allorhizobium pseudoryzae]|jgi:hypothetical protein|uniref:hypothetical protein n=1 Tax=Allorhizobium pseudoryzae TaxID=379684 RepID=UPI0013EC37D8|nr:hypothetical protein [Allorhizobium pseudoryzae]